MKYVSTILLVLAMYWTWGLSRTEQAISQTVHMGIQNDVKQFISEYIQTHSPNSTNLRFEKFWTEAVTDDQVKVIFTYSFEETGEAGPTRLEIDGFAVLNRQKEIVNGIEWGIDQIQVTSNNLDYQEPMQVSPGGSGEVREGTAIKNKPELSDEAPPVLTPYDPSAKPIEKPSAEKEPVKHE